MEGLMLRVLVPQYRQILRPYRTEGFFLPSVRNSMLSRGKAGKVSFAHIPPHFNKSNSSETPPETFRR